MTLVSFAGMASTAIGGILADKYGRKKSSIYSLVAICGSLMALPLNIISLTSGNFYLAMTSYVVRTLLGDVFWSPNITMIQKSCPPDALPSYMSGYQFANKMAAFTATLVFSLLLNFFGFQNRSPWFLGKILAVFGTFAYVGSIWSWRRAGQEYVKLRKRLYQEKLIRRGTV